MMSMSDISESRTLDKMLKLLRVDVSKILAKLDQSESLLEVEEVLEEEKWIATPDEYKIFDFIKSLALIATQLQPESFEETKRDLTEFWEDTSCDEEGEECDMELSVS